MRLVFKICFIFCSIPCFLSGQLKDLHFDQLSVRNGLSSNLATCILQDKEGFYWISTVDGLNRFDGTSFKIFRHSNKDSTSISHNLCSTILEGDDGDIWVATMAGVNRYRKKDGSFKRYYIHHPERNDDIANRINNLAKDKQGNIWVASYGLWKINPVNDSIQRFYHDKTNIASLSDPSEVRAVYYDSVANGLWIRTYSEIDFYDIGSGQFYHARHNPKQWKVFTIPNKPFLVTDGKELVWLYEEEGKKLYQFNSVSNQLSSSDLEFSKRVSNLLSGKDGNLLFKFDLMPSLLYNWPKGIIDTMPPPGENLSINARVLNFIYTDQQKNKWFCTKEGVFGTAAINSAVAVYTLPIDAVGFPHAIWSAAKGKDSTMWLGTKHGLYKYNLRQRVLIKSSDPSISVGIHTLYNAGDTMLWIASETAEIRLLDLRSNKIVRTIATRDEPTFIICDRQQHFWVGTWSEGLLELDDKGNIVTRYTTKDGFGYNYLMGGWYDGHDEIWIGMNGGKGFAKFNTRTKKIDNYLITHGPKNKGIIFNSVTSMVKDESGILWIGTYAGGLYTFDPASGQFEGFNQGDGLSGNFVNTLWSDHNGHLWVSTTNGIDIIDVKTRTCNHVNEHVEFDNNDYINNLLVDRNGILYYTSNSKIICIDPAKYARRAENIPIILSGFKIFDSEVPGITLASHISLPYNKNFFSAEYSVLKMSPDRPVQYRYKLDGLDNDWIDAGARGLATYTNVPHGKYTLLMNATDETGNWSEKPIALSIIIKPPFWKTWWFYLLVSIVVFCTILFIIKNRIRQVRKREHEQLRLVVATQEKEKRNISAELHDDLGVRLSALKYFVTSLKKYLSPGEQAEETYNKTIATIDESVEDVRYMLINLSPKTLNEYGYLAAVEDLVNKLGQLHIIAISLHQQGMEKRLHQETEASLYRITQELINNTLKHAEANNIELRIERSGVAIRLYYADDGKGFDPHGSKQGYGIDNIHTRVVLLNGTIEWEAELNKTTKVSIVIPYNHT